MIVKKGKSWPKCEYTIKKKVKDSASGFETRKKEKPWSSYLPALRTRFEIFIAYAPFHRQTLTRNPHLEILASLCTIC